MNGKYTKELPTKEGYYWWTNFGEHTPCILKVEEQYNGHSNPNKNRQLFASNEEFSFWIEPQEQLSLPIERDPDDEPRYTNPTTGEKFYYGDELWAYIEPAMLNNDTLEEDCF